MGAADRPARILVTRLGAMGDVIHALPAVADLRKRFPDAWIAWAVETPWTALLKENPHLNQVIPVPLAQWRRSKLSPASWRRVAGCVAELRTIRFDLALDFQGLLKSAICASASGAGTVVGFEREQLRETPAGLLYDRRVLATSTHVVDLNRELAHFGDSEGPQGPPDFDLPAGDDGKELPDRFVLASPRAGWGSKQWPWQHFAALASRLWRREGLPLVADCPPSQTSVAARIQEAAPPGAVILHPSSIPQLIAATRRASAVVGVDSGPLHLAAGIGKRGIAIFGPTDPARNGPCCDSIEVIRASGASTSYRRLPEPSASMRACSPELAYQRLRPMLR